LIDEVLAEFDKVAASSISRLRVKARPVRGVQIFTKINSLRFHVRKKFFKGDHLLLHPVTTIIDQNVDGRDLLTQFAEKGAVRLIADENLGIGVSEFRATRVDIDPNNLGIWTEVISPKLEGATLISSDFEYDGLAVSESLKMLFIDCQIMNPLANEAPIVLLKKFGQRFHMKVVGAEVG